VSGGLVLAAGVGTRFGGAKQLADLNGRPMLEHAVRAMVAAPVDRVCVVLGARAAEVRRAVDLQGAEVVVCDAWAEGQAASLRAGIAALAACDAVVVALGDQPFLSPAAVERVLHSRTPGADAVRATYGGVPGHPVVLECSLFGRVAALRGDGGARALLDDIRVEEAACDGLGRPDDIDTPDQLRGASDTAEEAITT